MLSTKRNVEIDKNGVLQCPTCDYPNLHQTKLDALFRKEDSSEGSTVTITRDSIQSSMGHGADDIYPGESGRRDALQIHFYCENCHEYNEHDTNLDFISASDMEKGNYDGSTIPIINNNPSKSQYILCIKQHKGYTYLEWKL